MPDRDFRHAVVGLVLLAAACGDSSRVSLNAKRLGHTSEAIGSYLYVFGGGILNTIERAKLSGDGSLDSFVELSDVRLASARTAHTSAVIGDFVYMFGGAADGAPSSASVERAPINSDGSIGSFEMLSGVVLNTARVAHASTRTETSVYVLGGSSTGTTVLDSVERAPINADGSLGPFATLSAIHLQTARRNFDAAAVGNYLYVFGGDGQTNQLDTIERAAINADGSLGAFEILADMKLATAALDVAATSIGARIYLTGGLHGALIPSNTVAFAPVTADGTIGGFIDSGHGLVVARGSHTATVASGSVYVIGGKGPDGITTSVERAAINADDTLADFENLSE